MLDPRDPLAGILERDSRYSRDAYEFVFDALGYAHRRLGMGEPGPADDFGDEDEYIERHITGQGLCEAIRQYALEQYGLVAKTVLADWGVRSTSDFGEIVFNLIDIGRMKKSGQDRREDFDDVFDFDQAFRQSFKITIPNPSQGRWV